MSQVRLQKFMASAGVASRRHAEELITAGRVRVNGKVVTEMGTKVDPDRDTVEVDGSLAVAKDHVYILLNKPKGYITTVDDPQGRDTVMKLLPPDVPKGVVPVGRLDFYTEGVLLFTNDGELAAALLHPRRHVEKTYHVKIRGEVREEHIEQLRNGVRLDDGRQTMPAKVDLLEFTGKHTWLVITIKEGRSRQIHRMAEALGYQVIKLARVAFGGLTYFGLKMGEHRKLNDQEVRALRHVAGLDLTEEERERDRETASQAAAIIAREERSERRGKPVRARGMQQKPPAPRAAGERPRTSQTRPENKPFAKGKWAAGTDIRPPRREDGPPRRREDGPPRRREDGPPRRPTDRPPLRRDAGPARRREDGPPRRPTDRPPLRRDAGPARRREDGPPLRRDAGPAGREGAPPRRDDRPARPFGAGAGDVRRNQDRPAPRAARPEARGPRADARVPRGEHPEYGVAPHRERPAGKDGRRKPFAPTGGPRAGGGPRTGAPRRRDR